MLSRSMPLSATGALLCSLPAGLWSRPARPGRRTTSSSDEDIMRERIASKMGLKTYSVLVVVNMFVLLLRSFTFPRRHDDPSRAQLGLAPGVSPRARPKEAIHTNSQRRPLGCFLVSSCLLFALLWYISGCAFGAHRYHKCVVQYGDLFPERVSGLSFLRGCPDSPDSPYCGGMLHRKERQRTRCFVCRDGLAHFHSLLPLTRFLLLSLSISSRLIPSPGANSRLSQF